jgi:hypothetical protein
MRYKEAEELEATGEWLMRVNSAGFADELLFVPSQLSKLGVAPVDVVDRLDYLKSQDHGPDMVDHDNIEVVDEPAGGYEPVVEPAEETLEERPLAFVEEPSSLVLDYDSYGDWEWARPIEKMVEEAFLAIFSEEPDLPDFNDVAALYRQTPSKVRRKGRRARARAVRAARTTEELVSNSVGAGA